MSLPDSTPQRHAAASAGIKLSHLFYIYIYIYIYPEFQCWTERGLVYIVYTSLNCVKHR
jgi:hypothetical protein